MKQNLIEYFIYRVIILSNKIGVNPDRLDRLKILNLYFLACTCSEKMLALSKFYYFPFGIIDSDIQVQIKKW